jgi:hypothetical protein
MWSLNCPLMLMLPGAASCEVRTVTLNKLYIYIGARGTVVVKALFYKPEGRGFDSR